MEESLDQAQTLSLIYAQVEQRYAHIVDLAHGWEHISRVYKLARSIGKREEADLFIVSTAALLHDLGHTVPRSSENTQGGAQAGHHTNDSVTLALEIMNAHGVPDGPQQAIVHAILAHSFSRRLEPETLEARVLRDADRLDALGALGIMRWSIVGAQRSNERTRTYHQDDPFAEQRTPDDHVYMLDHFFVKLFAIADTMTTPTGRSLAQSRVEFMHLYLHELRNELEDFNPLRP